MPTPSNQAFEHGQHPESKRIAAMKTAANTCTQLPPAPPQNYPPGGNPERFSRSRGRRASTLQSFESAGFGVLLISVMGALLYSASIFLQAVSPDLAATLASNALSA